MTYGVWQMMISYSMFIHQWPQIYIEDITHTSIGSLCRYYILRKNAIQIPKCEKSRYIWTDESFVYLDS